MGHQLGPCDPRKRCRGFRVGSGHHGLLGNRKIGLQVSDHDDDRDYDHNHDHDEATKAWAQNEANK